MELEGFVGKLEGVLRRLELKAGIEPPSRLLATDEEGAAEEGAVEEDEFPGVMELPADVFDGVCRGESGAVDAWLDSGGELRAHEPS